MGLIETVNLCQIYGGREILKNVNLAVNRGEVLALIGPTGTGKTTLLRLIDLIDRPASGKILFDGAEITASERARLTARRRMSFVLQKPVVFNTSVRDNVAYGLKWRGVPRSRVHREVANILGTVGLTEYGDRNARTLSGGEVQRVALARAIAVEPEVLLLDEPTANLDPVSAARVEEVIRDIIQRNTTTIIMATHDMAQGQRLADRMAVLIDGEITQTGSYSEVFASPGNRKVAEFVGIENVIDGVILSNDDRVVGIGVGGAVIEAISDYATGEEVSACVRPEDVTLAVSELSSSARNHFRGEVTRTVSLGPLTRVELDCDFPLVCLITSKSAEEMALVNGKRVFAAFKATGVHVIKREGS